MGKVILWPETQESQFRPDLAEEVEGYEGAVFIDVPADFTLRDKRVDWGTLTIVDDLQAVRDRRWEDAKAYRSERLNAPLPVENVVPGETIVVDCDLESRVVILTAYTLASQALAAGQPYSISFTDHANVQHELDALQVVLLGKELADFQGECHLASQGVRAALDAAVANGATAEEIAAIDITADYPTADAP